MHVSQTVNPEKSSKFQNNYYPNADAPKSLDYVNGYRITAGFTKRSGLSKDKKAVFIASFS